jgi:hypothetical protein
MIYVLLIGAAFNFYGAFTLLRTAIGALASEPGASDRSLHLTLFVAGTATVFGSLYVYLFFHPAFVFPFLIFGASLKTWAFLLSLYLYAKGRAPRQVLLEFGVGNGVIAALFWLCIAGV